jgi:hypothetical protein
MEERLRFVARLLDGEAMTEVCRDFGISHSGRSRSAGLGANRPYANMQFYRRCIR